MTYGNNEIIDSLCTKLALANKHNESMREALRLTRMHALTPQATDWDVVIDRIDKALALAEGKE